MASLKIIGLTFLFILIGFFLSIYAIFEKTGQLFTFAWFLFCFSLLLFIWLLSLPLGAETGEERGIRLFSFALAAVLIGAKFLLINYLLIHFYFK